MIQPNNYPVLEYDTDSDSVVNPFKWNMEQFKTNKLNKKYGWNLSRSTIGRYIEILKNS